jgi:hypothetical protein
MDGNATAREVGHVPRCALRILLRGYGYGGAAENGMILLGAANVFLQEPIQEAGFS